MPRKKILWLCSWYPNKMEPFNGDFVQRHAAAAALYNDIHVIHVAGDPSVIKNGTEEIINKAEGLTEQFIYFKKPTFFFRRWRNYHRWKSAYKKAVRQYISENGKPQLVHVHVPMPAGLVARKIKKKYHLPYLVTEHWTIYQPQNQLTYERHSLFFRSVLQRIVKGALLLLPVSKDLGTLMNKLVAKKEFLVVENVADGHYFYYPGEEQSRSPFRFIHVSNMSWQKNTGEIVKCFSDWQREFPEAEMIMVGPVSSAIQQLVEKTGLLGHKIFLKGEVNYSAVAEEMRQAHVLVLFSRFENSPCSIIEALCCGLPVIASRVGGIPELLDKNNGLLVDPTDKQALYGAMTAMAKTYSNYDRKKIAELARSRFSYPVIGKRFDEIYNKVLGSS